jgi:hypothetical protein
VPASITFWQTPEDESDLLDFILATGVVVAIPAEGVRTREELAPQPLALYIHQRDPSQLRMGLEEQAHRVAIEEKEQGGEGHFQVAYMSPCLVNYRRGRMRESGRLGQSHLSAYWSYPDVGATGLIAKDPDFIRWAKRVFDWVRRHTPERVVCQGYPYRATMRVKEGVERGNLEAVLY